MISNDSLWLDEGNTAIYALQPDLKYFFHRLWIDRQADCQMPLSMFCTWIGGVILGLDSEWQLRAGNFFWGAAALIALARIGRRLEIPWLPMLLAIQPYFWFYMNEARPYALELGGGAWVLVALVEFVLDHAAGTIWAWTLAIAGFLLFGATMLAVLPVGMTVLAGAFFAWRHGWRLERRAAKILLLGLTACVPLAAFYATTLYHGVIGAQVWRVDAKFVAYVFYEFTGMGGIGLSYADIRELARSPQLAHELAARLPQLLLPALLGVMLVGIFFQGLRRRLSLRPPTVPLAIVLALGLTAGVLVTASLVLHKAFWARHYAPVFPFYVTLLGIALAGIFSGQRSWRRRWPVLALALLLWSALAFRFAPALRKEDYRSAVRFTKQTLVEGKSVWWLASGYPAIYYDLDVAFNQPQPGKPFCPLRSPLDLHTLPLPDVVVISKPDLHDPDGAVQKIIAENHYGIATRYQSFTIWTNAVVKPEN